MKKHNAVCIDFVAFLNLVVTIAHLILSLLCIFNALNQHQNSENLRPFSRFNSCKINKILAGYVIRNRVLASSIQICKIFHSAGTALSLMANNGRRYYSHDWWHSTILSHCIKVVIQQRTPVQYTYVSQRYPWEKVLKIQSPHAKMIYRKNYKLY